MLINGFSFLSKANKNSFGEIIQDISKSINSLICVLNYQGSFHIMESFDNLSEAISVC